MGAGQQRLWLVIANDTARIAAISNEIPGRPFLLK